MWTTGTQLRVDGDREEILGGDPARTVQRGPMALWPPLPQQKGDSERNRNALAKEPSIPTHIRAGCVVTSVPEVLLEVVQEQVSKGHSPRTGLTAGPLEAKIRTVQLMAETGDVLA